MKADSRIVLLGNAGLAIISRGTKIIVDGLYKDLKDYFTDLPPAVWDLMRRGQGDLANVDYLFFTHDHFDHYYGPYVKEYLGANRVQKILLPPLSATIEGPSKKELRGAEELPSRDGRIALAPGLSVRILTVRHVDKLYHNVAVQCLLFDLQGVKVLITSDADYLEEAYLQIKEEKIAYAFVTPVFYNHPEGRRILTEALQVEKIVIYHLPDGRDDKFGYYQMVQHDVEKYGKENDVLVWRHFGQYIDV